MAAYEAGTFLFPQGVKQKNIALTKNFINPITVSLTSTNKNINVYLTDVTNNYFIVEKNTSDEVSVSYVVIESES
jgi:hypothetical protein